MKSDGAVACWGWNDNGQANAPAGTFQRMVVSVGGSHTCGLKSDGTLACWGRNGNGQTNAPAGAFTQVSAGHDHTCGVESDGAVACWGLNDYYGQATPPAGAFTQVSAGDDHTCGVESDGAVACWGRDSWGQTTPPAGAFTQISAGSSHTCGLKSNGAVACWGYNDNGQVTPPAGTFTQLSAGSYHNCGLKSDGAVACWGWNKYGQATPPAGAFTQVSAGFAHTCGLKDDGTVVCWGDNKDGFTTPPAGSFTQVSAGVSHTCGVKSDGAVACWGNNNSGQSGTQLLWDTTGTGSGSVSRSPEGIFSCKLLAFWLDNYECVTYPPLAATTVELTATPEAGSSFAGWSGDCTNLTGACMVTMDTQRRVVAIFNRPNSFFLLKMTKTGTGTVSSNPAGITCGIDCTESYLGGTVVTLTATPAPGFIFTGWSGDADCADGRVAVIAARTCMATFNPSSVTYTLAVTKAGAGVGTVTSTPVGLDCGAYCSEAHTSGTVVTLTATPATGSTFAGWSGDADCADGQVTLSAAKTCTAAFNLTSIVKTPYDFDGDGKADILWRDAATEFSSGQNRIYLMNGANLVTDIVVNTVADLNWKVVGVGDFNGDGKADILWRHATTGQNRMYLMNGATLITDTVVNTVADLNWKVVGVGDFNGDGKADILWRHATSGQNWMYLMNGATLVTNKGVNTVADLNLQVVGVGDFDGDGKADILWRHATTGLNRMYLMNGATLVTNKVVNTVADLNWKVVGVGDFNGDGKADILWRHATTGQNWMYLMNGATLVTNKGVNTVADLNWKVAEAADFDGDGKADILWRHATTGQYRMYLMNGATLVTNKVVNTVAETIAGRLWHNDSTLDYRNSTQIAFPSGAAPVYVTTNEYAKPWPDGSQYVIDERNVYNHYTDVTVVDTATRATRYQLRVPNYLRTVKPSPVNKKLVIATWGKDSISAAEYIVLDLATGEILYRVSTAGVSVNWLPDGRYMLITTDGRITASEVGGAGQALGQLALPAGHEVMAFWVNRQGTQMALLVWHPSGIADIYDSDLWVARLDGSQLERLTQTRMTHYANWSPDGKYIAFDVDTGHFCNTLGCMGICESLVCAAHLTQCARVAGIERRHPVQREGSRRSPGHAGLPLAGVDRLNPRRRGSAPA